MLLKELMLYVGGNTNLLIKERVNTLTHEVFKGTEEDWALTEIKGDYKVKYLTAKGDMMLIYIEKSDTKEEN